MQFSVTVAAEPRRLPWLGRVRGRSTAVRCALLVAVAALMIAEGRPSSELRIRQAVGPRAFQLLDWEATRLLERAGRIGAGLAGRHSTVDLADRNVVANYFEVDAGQRAEHRMDAEAVIERALSSILSNEGLALELPLVAPQNLIFPPVSFSFVSPPRVLVVSPRDRIAVIRSELLSPDVGDREAGAIETGVDRGDASSLVVSIGGLATFPAMVLEGTGPLDSLIGVAHEWIHGYFFLHPLGRSYWANPTARTINETAADIASRELGRRLGRELGLSLATASAPNYASQRPREAARDLRAVLRTTRVEVDELLASGQVEEAEGLMSRRRDELQAAGHNIRKLNQAYFAFHGSYGDAAAGSSPIPGRLQRLRESSGSVGEFLRRVAQLRDGRDLARSVGDA